MATHSNILGWKIPWTVDLGRLQSMGSQGTGHDWGLRTEWQDTHTHTHTHTHSHTSFLRTGSHTMEMKSWRRSPSLCESRHLTFSPWQWPLWQLTNLPADIFQSVCSYSPLSLETLLSLVLVELNSTSLPSGKSLKKVFPAFLTPFSTFVTFVISKTKNLLGTFLPCLKSNYF